MANSLTRCAVTSAMPPKGHVINCPAIVKEVHYSTQGNEVVELQGSGHAAFDHLQGQGMPPPGTH